MERCIILKPLMKKQRCDQLCITHLKMVNLGRVSMELVKVIKYQGSQDNLEMNRKRWALVPKNLTKQMGQ